jgi:hypothetical protein
MTVLRIIKDSWNTLRHHRALWFFGFFVAGAGGGGARLSHHANIGSMGWLPVALAAAAIVGLAVFALQVISEGALIDGVRRTARGERYPLATGFRAGMRYFGRVLGLKLATLLTVLATVLAAAVPLIAVRLAGGPAWAGALGTVPLALVCLPWLLSVYFIYEFALRAAVVENVGLRSAVSRGLAFLQSRLSLSLWLVIAAGAGQLVAGLVGLCALVPIALVGGAVYLASGLLPAAITAAVLFAPVGLCLVGALGAYRSSVWTHGYLLGRVESA